MARPRVFLLNDSQAGVYHVVSRIVDKRLIFGEAEKDAFVRMMRAMAAFHQVEVLTFCVMGNHFHILLRVPPRPEGFAMGLDEMLVLWGRAVGPAWKECLQRQFDMFRQNGSEAAIEEWRQRMLSHMFTLSGFMKALKQRFTQWYNRRTGRQGTLWEGRYRSVVVQDAASALRAISAYIDLNPVRAGLVSDPAAYRWCGYSEAMVGKEEAIAGLSQVCSATPEAVHGRSLEVGPVVESGARRRRRLLKALVIYRQLLGIAGVPRTNAAGRTVRRGLSEAVRARLAAEPGMAAERLLRRVKHFTRGVVIGSREFVNSWFEEHRWWMGGRSGERRRTGARRIAKEGASLHALRQLKDEATLRVAGFRRD